MIIIKTGSKICITGRVTLFVCKFLAYPIIILVLMINIFYLLIEIISKAPGSLNANNILILILLFCFIYLGIKIVSKLKVVYLDKEGLYFDKVCISWKSIIKIYIPMRSLAWIKQPLMIIIQYTIEEKKKYVLSTLPFNKAFEFIQKIDRYQIN